MNFKFAILATIAWIFFDCNVLFSQVLTPSASYTREIRSLNGTWKFKYIPSSQTGADALFYEPHFDVSQWADIKVPGNWEVQGFAQSKYRYESTDATGRYRTSFSIPAYWKENPVYITFDGLLYGYSPWKV
jgi:beta-galactosidase/beta-glucuronidase